MLDFAEDDRTLGFATKFEVKEMQTKRELQNSLDHQIAEFLAKGGKIQKFGMGDRGNDTFCYKHAGFGDVVYLENAEGSRLHHVWDLKENNYFDSSLTTNNNRIYGKCLTPGCEGRKVVYYPDTETRNSVENRVNPAFSRAPLSRILD